MNPSRYGCNETDNTKDDDSVISDRCWEEKYKGDSRRWLIRDASRQKTDSSVSSTMKDTYLYPEPETDEQYVGKIH